MNLEPDLLVTQYITYEKTHKLYKVEPSFSSWVNHLVIQNCRSECYKLLPPKRQQFEVKNQSQIKITRYRKTLKYKRAKPLKRHSHPIKRLALLFLQQEETYCCEERNVKQISILLPVNSNNILQKPLWFRRNQICPQPIVNRVLHQNNKVMLSNQRPKQEEPDL